MGELLHRLALLLSGCGPPRLTLLLVNQLVPELPVLVLQFVHI